MKLILQTLLLFLSLSVFAQKDYYMLVGTYTKGKSDGINVYKFNATNGTVQAVDSVKTSNPSYLAVSPNGKFVYAVNENDGGKITAFAFDRQTGQLKELNQQPSEGSNPCYIVVDKTGKWVIVGNYSSGTLAVLPIKNDGTLGEPDTTIRHTGHGVNKDRQESPHVHSTVLSPDDHYLFVADLGIDKEMIYGFNPKTGNITTSKEPFVKLKDGSGPRHFIFHPNGKWAYLIQEMGGTITAFNYANGQLKTIETVSSLPKDFKGSFTAADIHISPDGHFLYASNRDQSNTIVAFRIDQKTGKLTQVGSVSAMGKTPRNFNIDPSGNYLLVANQNSDNIVIYKINKKTGQLTYTGKQVYVGNPVCIKFTRPL
jgi:6-phosphogluconolactonase